MTDNSAAAFIAFLIFGLPMGYAIVNRYLTYQERLEMIRHGIVPPPDPRMLRRMARYGATAPDAYYAASANQAQRLLRSGVIVTMVGFALTVGLSFIEPGHPGPWLIGGLVPMFIGIAQIILAVLQGVSVRVAQFGPPPPAGQPPFQQPPQQPPNAWAWRPGPTTELEKPVSPPDRTS